MSKHGQFHWNEYVTRDVEAAKEFYASSLGWQFNPMDMGESGTYWIALSGDQVVAGICPLLDDEGSEGTKEGWMGYIAVDDVVQRVAKAEAAGAKRIGDFITVPDTGTIAMVQQPDGTMIGWITPAEGLEA